MCKLMLKAENVSQMIIIHILCARASNRSLVYYHKPQMIFFIDGKLDFLVDYGKQYIQCKKMLTIVYNEQTTND